MQSNGQIPTRIPNDGTTITVDMQNFVEPGSIARFSDDADCSSINPEFTFLQILNVTNDYCDSFDSDYCDYCPTPDLIRIPDYIEDYSAEIRYVKLDKATNELVFRADDRYDGFLGNMTVRLYISPFEIVPGRQMVHVDITFLVLDAWDYDYYEDRYDYYDYCNSHTVPEALTNVFIEDDGALIYTTPATINTEEEVVPDDESEADDHHDESSDIFEGDGYDESGDFYEDDHEDSSEAYEGDDYDYGWLHLDAEDHAESAEADEVESEPQEYAKVDESTSDNYDNSLLGSVAAEIGQQLPDFVQLASSEQFFRTISGTAV